MFSITSATGIVQDLCYLVDALISLGQWTGWHEFVISSKKAKHQVVLGIDFLRSKKVLNTNDT